MASVMRNAFYGVCKLCKTESEKKTYKNQQQQQGVIHT